MASLRKGKAYRDADKPPYTRKSKYRQKNFIKGIPGSKIVKFDDGNRKGVFTHVISIVSERSVNLRHNALEAARVSANKFLTTKLGNDNFFMKIKPYPHNIMRENPIAGGAGADRYSTGMSLAFGKPIGYAARVRAGQEVVYLKVNENNISLAKQAIKKMTSKLSGKYTVVISKAENN